jgi:hypothetical protein
MRGVKAKRIRRAAFLYTFEHKLRTVVDRNDLGGVSYYMSGLRRVYQDMKRAVKRG